MLSMLLYNAETWQEISNKTIDELEKLQLNFLRAVLGVGSGCPKDNQLLDRNNNKCLLLSVVCAVLKLFDSPNNL